MVESRNGIARRTVEMAEIGKGRGYSILEAPENEKTVEPFKTVESAIVEPFKTVGSAIVEPFKT
eukprot:3207363-Karenia_brevis.AAC.1